MYYHIIIADSSELFHLYFKYILDQMVKCIFKRNMNTCQTHFKDRLVFHDTLNINYVNVTVLFAIKYE